MKKRRTHWALRTLVAMWIVAGVAMFCTGVFVFGCIVTRRTPWDSSKDEMRVSGERVVAAVEKYKATYGYLPKTLREVGIDSGGIRTTYFYMPKQDGFTLVVTSGPDEWWYDSGSGEWRWDANANGGG